MSQIIILSLLIGIVGILLFYLIVRLIYKKLKGEEIKLKTNLLYIGLCVLMLGGLIVTNLYLVTSKVIEKKDEIVDMGQEVLSNTVEFGATAVFEGMGKTMDHFKEKWKNEDDMLSKDIEITITETHRKKIDEQSDSLSIVLILNNQSLDNASISLRQVAKYLLIGDQDSLLYPLTCAENCTSLPIGNTILPSGKTRHTFHSIIPHTFDLRFIRFHDKYKSVKE